MPETYLTLAGKLPESGHPMDEPNTQSGLATCRDLRLVLGRPAEYFGRSAERAASPVSAKNRIAWTPLIREAMGVIRGSFYTHFVESWKHWYGHFGIPLPEEMKQEKRK